MPTLEELQAKYGKKAQEEKKDSKIEESEVIHTPKHKVQKTGVKVLPTKKDMITSEKQKIVSRKPEKSILNEVLDFNISKMQVVIELNEKTLSRTKSGLVGQYGDGVKNYGDMNVKELDNELSKIIAKGVLKVLKGAENNGK